MCIRDSGGSLFDDWGSVFNDWGNVLNNWGSVFDNSGSTLDDLVLLFSVSGLKALQIPETSLLSELREEVGRRDSRSH